MNLAEWIRFVYGLILGTSTPLIDLSSRHHRPLTKTQLGNLTVFMGGCSNCVVIPSPEGLLLVNTNMGTSAERIYHQIGSGVIKIINQKAHPYFCGGNELFIKAQDIYVGPYPHGTLIKIFGDRKCPKNLIYEKTEIHFGNEKLILDPIIDGMFAGNLVIYLVGPKILLLGDLFYHKIFPPLGIYPNVNLSQWQNLLERFLKEYKPQKILPAEGELCGPEQVMDFMEFLTDIHHPHPDPEKLKVKYPWEEIPGISSLNGTLEYLANTTR